MKHQDRDSRACSRRALLQELAATATVMLPACATVQAHERHAPEPKPDEGEAEVTPGEDLMQEHGVLERILLVYEEGARRLEQGQALDLAILSSAAGIVRRFVEDYHEKQEEESIFPRLEAAKREVELVAVLRQQHQRGRVATDEALRLIAGGSATPQLAQVLRSFITMYRPHAAREDTVLFPAFRAVVGRAAYHELGEKFEEHEHELFGERGFEAIVDEVARLEQALGIHDLAKFTPA